MPTERPFPNRVLAADPLAVGEMQPHPAWRSTVATRVVAEVRRASPERLVLIYRLFGDIRKLEIPAGATPLRRDELWVRTCFEAFFNVPGSPAYYEFNFAPSQEWAAYAFDDYRAGMRDHRTDPPVIHKSDDRDELEVMVAQTLPPPLRDTPLRLALSAVVLATDGTKSYWALAHPPGRPDFHHSDSFVLELPAP